MTQFKSAHLLNAEYQSLLEMASSPQTHKIFEVLEKLNNSQNDGDKKQALANIDVMMTSFSASDDVSADKKLIAPANDKQQAVDLYVFYPDNHQGETLPVLFWIHGGGLIMGNANQQNPSLKALANANGVAVVSLEYTLATTAPHPADMLDAYHGLSYVFENAKEFGFDANNIIIMGESGGGTVASRLALYNAEQGKYQPKGLVLIYPMLDYRTGGDDDVYRNEFAGEFIWTKQLNQLGWTTSQGGKDLNSHEMRFFSPAVVADVSKLPPTFMIVGGLDLFANETVAFANKLLVQGVPTECHLLNGVPHIFEALNPASEKTQTFFNLRNTAIAKMIAGNF